MAMPDPWSINQNFINQLSRRSAQTRDTADSALLQMIASQVGRGDMAMRQNYGLEDMAEQNRYARIADTTAYDRQLSRDETAYTRAGEAAQQQRRYALEDAQASGQAGLAKEVLSNKLAAEREMAKGEYPGASAYAASTIQRESGGNTNAKNPNSSAGGLGQFLTGTWNDLARRRPELGLTPATDAFGPSDGRRDPEQSKRALGAFTGENSEVLARNGIEPNDANKYAAHFLGAGDAIKVLHAPDGDPVYMHVEPASMRANPHLKNMTVADFKAWTAKGHGGGTSETVAGQRRYGEDPTQRVSTEILGLPVPNAAGAVSNEPSKWAQEIIGEGREGIPLKMTATQAKIVQENLLGDEQLIVDLEKASTAAAPKAGAAIEWLWIRPLREQPVEATAHTDMPKAKETTAASVKPQLRKPKKVTLEDGTEMDIPD